MVKKKENLPPIYYIRYLIGMYMLITTTNPTANKGLGHFSPNNARLKQVTTHDC